MSTARVLILDDEPDFVAYVRRVAEDVGYEVQGVTRAQEFQRVYSAFEPSLVVLDMVMPEVDGIEVARWLAEQGFSGCLLLVTGYTPHYATGARVIAQAHGLKDVRTLKKPLRLRELKDVLAEQREAVAGPSPS